MKIFVTGATGFIGRAAVTYLQGQGHDIIAWVRSPDRARSVLGNGPELLDVNSSRQELRQHLEISDAVLNLAGKPLIGNIWTKANKKAFWESRVGLTSILSEEIRKCTSPPAVLVSASAVGFYGDRGDEILTEESKEGEGFPSDLCRAWEKAALDTESKRTRVCVLRLGIVLGREGGILGLLTPFFQTGIGGYLGNGLQYIPWINLLDVLRIIKDCIEQPSFSGIFNCTSPNPVRSREFSRQVASLTSAKIVIRVPTFLPKMVLGEAGGHFAIGQYVTPARLIDNGFKFAFDNIIESLHYEYDYKDISIKKFDRLSNSMERDKIIGQHAKRGHYELRSTSELNTDPETAFSFFSSPLNLGLATPSWVGFQIKEAPETIRVGARISYTIRVLGIPFRWVTEIIAWEPVNRFIDIQTRGPYSLWCHEHIIRRKEDGQTVMEDRVIYKMPLGILGRAIHRLMVMDQLKRIFRFRQRVIALRFGGSKPN